MKLGFGLKFGGRGKAKPKMINPDGSTTYNPDGSKTQPPPQ